MPKSKSVLGLDDGLAVGAAVVGLDAAVDADWARMDGFDQGIVVGLITREDVPSVVVVAAKEDIDNYDASKKCKEAGGARDSIDEDDEDNDDNDDDTSSSSLVDDHGDDDSDDIARDFQQRRKMKIAHNQARLTQLGLYDNLETKKTIKMKSAQRSLAPNGPRRRNPVRSTRDNEPINASPSIEPNNQSTINHQATKPSIRRNSYFSTNTTMCATINHQATKPSIRRNSYFSTNTTMCARCVANQEYCCAAQRATSSPTYTALGCRKNLSTIGCVRTAWQMSNQAKSQPLCPQ